MLNNFFSPKNPLFLVIYYTIVLVYDTLYHHHLIHNLLLSIDAQFQSIIYRTFLCVLSPSFRIIVLRKMTLKSKKWCNNNNTLFQTIVHMDNKKIQC